MSEVEGGRGDDFGVRVGLRPIGNPLPLGFLALAATFPLAGMQLDWASASESKDVALALIVFVFPLQFLAAVFAFIGRDGDAAAGLALAAGGWLATGLVLLTSVPGSTSDALGLFLLAAAVALLVPAVGAGAGNALAGAVPAVTALRFACTGIYELTGSGTWETIAGISGLLLLAVALACGIVLARTREVGV